MELAALATQVLHHIAWDEQLNSSEEMVAAKLVKQGLLWKDGSRAFQFASELHRYCPLHFSCICRVCIGSEGRKQAQQSKRAIMIQSERIRCLCVPGPSPYPSLSAIHAGSKPYNQCYMQCLDHASCSASLSLSFAGSNKAVLCIADCSFCMYHGAASAHAQASLSAS